MAKKNKKGSNKPFAKQETQSKPADKKSDDSSTKQESKLSNNKPLIGVLVLIGLIALSAVGVGAYYAYQSITSDDDSAEETSTTEDSDEADGNQEDSDQDDEDSESNNTDETDEADTDSENDSDDSEDEDSSNNNDDDSDSEDNESGENENLDDSNGSISESSAKTSIESNPGYKKSAANQLVIESTGVWQATDYVPGDITQSEYQVQLGDTLWEIAEGYYGSGFDWGKILNSNQSKIGYLPNGEQALITPGTVLVLPQ